MVKVLNSPPLLDSVDSPAARYTPSAGAPSREPLLADEQRHTLGELAPRKQYRAISKKRLAFREASGYSDSGRGGPGIA